jgi:hypothetical protein
MRTWIGSMSRYTLAVAAASVWTAVPAAGHDFWIRPTTFSPRIGERFGVGLFVGERADVDEFARRPNHILRFESVRGSRSLPIAGVVGRSPAGSASFDEPGVVVLVYQSRHAFLELPAAKFEAYLQEEGLGDIIAARERAKSRSAKGRESYARYCKSIVRVDGGPAGGFDVQVGLPLELTVETDPFAWRSGEAVVLHLVFNGTPLRGRSVKLVHLDEPERRLTATTDAEGRVRFEPSAPGPWLAATVHMRAAQPPLVGDWESFWASVTFALQDSVPASTPRVE